MKRLILVTRAQIFTHTQHARNPFIGSCERKIRLNVSKLTQKREYYSFCYYKRTKTRWKNELNRMKSEPRFVPFAMVWCQCCKNFSELRNSNKFQWNLNLMLIFDSILTCAWGKTFRSHENIKFGRVSRMALPMNVPKRVRCTLVVSSIGFPNRIKCSK